MCVDHPEAEAAVVTIPFRVQLFLQLLRLLSAIADAFEDTTPCDTEGLQSKVFSRKKMYHFWRFAKTDDHVGMLRTLNTPALVNQARWGVFHPNRDVTERPLLCILAEEGCPQCIEALLQAYPEAFSKADTKEAIAFVDSSRNLSYTRRDCVKVLATKSRGVSQLCMIMSAFVKNHWERNGLPEELCEAISVCDCTLDRLKGRLEDETEDYHTRKGSLSWVEHGLTLVACLLLLQGAVLEVNEEVYQGNSLHIEIDESKKTSKQNLMSYASSCFGTTWGPHVFSIFLVFAERVLPSSLSQVV